jgi:hypothetical protein
MARVEDAVGGLRADIVDPPALILARQPSSAKTQTKPPAPWGEALIACHTSSIAAPAPPS